MGDSKLDLLDFYRFCAARYVSHPAGLHLVIISMRGCVYGPRRVRVLTRARIGPRAPPPHFHYCRVPISPRVTDHYVCPFPHISKSPNLIWPAYTLLCGIVVVFGPPLRPRPTKWNFLIRSFPRQISVAAFLATHHKDEDDFPDLINEYRTHHHCIHTPTPPDNKHSGIILLVNKQYDVLHSEIKMPGRMVNVRLQLPNMLII